jgi:hypothetical protein
VCREKLKIERGDIPGVDTTARKARARNNMLPVLILARSSLLITLNTD